MAVNSNVLKNDVRTVFLKEPHDSQYEFYQAYRSVGGFRIGMAYLKAYVSRWTRVLVISTVVDKAGRVTSTEKRFPAYSIDKILEAL